MDSQVALEVILTFSITAVLSFIAYLWLSRLFSTMKISGKQLLKTLPTALILPAIPIVLFVLFNPQNVTLSEPLTYAWELIFFAVWIFLMDCRVYFIYFGKKNLADVRGERNKGSTI